MANWSPTTLPASATPGPSAAVKQAAAELSSILLRAVQVNPATTKEHFK